MTVDCFLFFFCFRFLFWLSPIRLLKRKKSRIAVIKKKKKMRKVKEKQMKGEFKPQGPKVSKKKNGRKKRQQPPLFFDNVLVFIEVS